MPAQQESWVATAYLSGATGPVAVGTVLCLNAAGDSYIIATSANRAAAGRPPACIVLSGGDGTNIAVEAQYVGVVPPNITGLGVGAAAFVNVSSAGVLARQGAQDPTTVGKCDADGTAYVCFPFSGLSGGGGFTPPTGTGFIHDTAGVLDSAARAVNIATADVTGTLPVGNGGTGLATPGTSGNVLTSNGTAWTSAAPAGQSVGLAGQIQTSNGTNAFNAPGPYAGSGYVSTIAGALTFGSGMRIGNNTVYAGQNFAGTADIVCCYIDSANVVRIGSSFDATQGGVLFGIRSGASLKYEFDFGSTQYFSVSETEVTSSVPRHGYASSPYASEGQSTIAITTTTYTLTTEVSNRILKFTGTYSGTCTVTFPLPSSAANSYGKSIRNTSTSPLVLSVGSGTTFKVPASAHAEVMVTPDGIFGEGRILDAISSNGRWAGPFSSSPWRGRESAGFSGTADLTEPTNPPTAGTVVGACTPAHFNGTSSKLSNAAPVTPNFVSTTQWACWVMFKASAAAADGGAGSRYQSPHFWAASDTHASLGVGFNSGGIFAHQGDATPTQHEVITACATGAWHVAFAWWDGSVLHLQLDQGTAVTTSCTSQDSSLTAGGLNVGTNYNSGAFYSGDIMDLEIRDTQFATGEIATIYAALKARYPNAGLP